MMMTRAPTPACVQISTFLSGRLHGRALRKKQIRFPEENGPVRWALSNKFFRVGEIGFEAGSRQDEIKEGTAIPAEREDTTPCESH